MVSHVLITGAGLKSRSLIVSALISLTILHNFFILLFLLASLSFYCFSCPPDVICSLYPLFFLISPENFKSVRIFSLPSVFYFLPIARPLSSSVQPSLLSYITAFTNKQRCSFRYPIQSYFIAHDFATKLCNALSCFVRFKCRLVDSWNAFTALKCSFFFCFAPASGRENMHRHGAND